MRIKIDENLPAILVDVLAEFGHDAETSPSEGLAGKSDEDIWAAAVAAGRFLITQDMDFSDMRRYTPGTHPGILLVRLRDPSRAVFVERLSQILRTEDIADWEGCIVVTTEHKVRVRRP